jgi:hypothetical protein
MSVIISQIIGGLGNQMFQYATGRALALARELSLRLDVSGFEGYGLHQGFELQRVFGCAAPLASDVELRVVLGWRATPLVRRILARPELAALRGHALVVEPYFHYWPGIRNVPATVYLQGYWQSERYFAEVTDAIRADFTFRQPLSAANAAVAEKIGEGGTAVSLHVRRGDYVSNPRTNAAHGLCTLDYYRAAVRYVAERVDAPQFFIFSDDISWAQENLGIDYPCHYIGHNQGLESYNDMRLMSLCHHHIIANSSFSWWGAWLNPREDKIVVAPARWFANGGRCLDDLYPSGWVQL